MSTVVTALFPDTRSAHAALDAVASAAADHGPVEGVLHEGRVHEEELPLPGTDALAGAVFGGLVVGGVAALLAGFVLWPDGGYWFGWSAILMMFVAGSVFGVVAGAVAGASEARVAIRNGSDAIRRGNVLLTCEVEDDDVPSAREALTRAGGHDVLAA